MTNWPYTTRLLTSRSILVFCHEIMPDKQNRPKTGYRGRAGVRGPRGRGAFRRNDVLRAIKSARDAGLPVGSIEVITADGVRIRVNSASGETSIAPENLKDLV
jgi:hypothetical protein